MHHLVVIGYVWPEPNSSAAGYHMLSLIRAFQDWGWQVTFASPAAAGEHRFALTEIGVAEVSIALNCSSFDSWIKEQAPDAVLFDRFMMEEQFGWRVAKNCPQALQILDLEDLHSLRDARQQILKQQLRDGPVAFPMLMDHAQLYPQMASSDMAKREIAAIHRADLSLVISHAELQLLTREFHVPPQELLHCPFIQPPALTDTPSFANRQHFVSIGNFRHAPNWDAVRWLKESIWPQIRQQLPQAQLHVYGAYPPKKATQLHNERDGFLVKGWVEDAHQAIAASRVLLAPLRFGAGIKGKLLDAMRTGTPSVTTPIGAEGMLTSADWPGEVCDTASHFADAAVTLYKDADRWQQAQQTGWCALEKHFDAALIRSQLYARIVALIQPDQLAQHRAQNFTGQMLQHHQHRSTQFMSQWIEVKQQLSDLKSGTQTD
ncbi:glycosyltransferase [Neptunomonas marina]|uniref:Glycosyltransferase n=1 Tax=Neptunomonas marina TaxID=1815562 RepID=A0A437Q659_9GAMM|nr:glycosyltransferase [Neptunomonas marina]RVU29999.1 glycosyltransferase [Neptunomonas marina]